MSLQPAVALPKIKSGSTVGRRGARIHAQGAHGGKEEIHACIWNSVLCDRLRCALPSKRALAFFFMWSVAGALVSCRTTPPPAGPGEPVAGFVEARYELFEETPAGAELAGYMAKTRYRFPTGDLVLWLVENRHFQELGFIDENGRAWRKLAFAQDPEWVATGSLDKGARALLRATVNITVARIDGAPESVTTAEILNASAVRRRE